MTKKRMTKAEKAAQALALFNAAPIADAEAAQDAKIEAEILVEKQPTLDQAMTALVTVKTHKVVKTVKTGVGAQILQHIADGVLSNKEIVAQVLADNPLRKTTYACVAWYKSQVAAGKIDLPAARLEVMDEDMEESNEE